MKIRTVTSQNQNKALALLGQSFTGSTYEVHLVEKLHEHGKVIYDWVGINANKVVAYVALTHAYNGTEICGYHLGPLVVKKEFRNKGIASELLRYVLRQDLFKESTIFVFGAVRFYQKFGFEQCPSPICPLDEKNAHFYSLRNTTTSIFDIGYEDEFYTR